MKKKKKKIEVYRNKIKVIWNVYLLIILINRDPIEHKSKTN